MSMYVFGSGTIWAVPTHDCQGQAISNPTPIMLGTVQESSVEFSGEIKTLYGQGQFPVDVARGKASVKGSCKVAAFSAAAFNTIYFGATKTNQGAVAYAASTGTTISASITIDPPSNGTFLQDLGVIDVATGKPFERVSATPSTGQYAVNEQTGVYTFSTPGSNPGKVYINYLYTNATTAATEVLKVTNTAMGQVPKFKLVLQQVRGENLTLTLPACVSESLKISFKNDDFAVPELSFQACADAAGNVCEWSQG